MTILTVQLIVEFAKGLPGFSKISQPDQITLLKVKYTTVYGSGVDRDEPESYTMILIYLASLSFMSSYVYGVRDRPYPFGYHTDLLQITTSAL